MSRNQKIDTTVYESEVKVQTKSYNDLELDKNGDFVLTDTPPSAWLHNLQQKVRAAELEYEEKIRKKFEAIYGERRQYSNDPELYVARFDAFKEGYKLANSDTIRELKQHLHDNGLQITQAVKSE